MNTLIETIISGGGCSAIISVLLLIIFGMYLLIHRLWKKIDEWEKEYKDIAEKYNQNLGQVQNNLENFKELLHTIQNEFFRK